MFIINFNQHILFVDYAYTTISYQNHPISDLPCFWVHPCQTAEAMCEITSDVALDSNPLKYLMTWIGMVGVTVGLSLPIEMAVYASEKHP